MKYEKAKKTFLITFPLLVSIYWYISQLYYIYYNHISSSQIEKKIHPQVGNAGIALAQTSFEWFGYACIFVPLFLLLPSYYYWKNIPRNKKFWYQTGAVFLLLINASISLQYYFQSETTQDIGGLVGNFFANKILLNIIGNIGTIIFTTALFIYILLFFSENKIFQLINEKYKSVLEKMGNFKISKKNEKSSKKKQKKDNEKDTQKKFSFSHEPSINEKSILNIEKSNENKISVSDKTDPKSKSDSEKIQIVDMYQEKDKIDKLNLAKEEYVYPQLEILEDPPKINKDKLKEDQMINADKLIEELEKFKVRGEIYSIQHGPIITTYEIKPAPGVKVNKFTSLSNDLALVMKAESVRIIAPIPNKEAVGIEIPNEDRATIYMKEILKSNEFNKRLNENSIILTLGKDTTGRPKVADLCKMPHLLIAGATGSGKSVCINSLITSILYQSSPKKVKLMMIDPKRVELSIYEGIPHLLHPVIVQPEDAVSALEYTIDEMERRYEMLAEMHVRNIKDYNKFIKTGNYKRFLKTDNQEPPEIMPYWVVIIDELANLMMVAGKEIEKSIARLAQMSRAVGIHLIVATQRPSVDIITGVIKANFPSRIAFRTSSRIDSRTILDETGSEKLLGNGDMLFKTPSESSVQRIHGSFLRTEEVLDIVSFVKENNSHLKDESISLEPETEEGDFSLSNSDDELISKAAELVVLNQQASVSMLQRRLGIGYARAGKLIDQLEQARIIGPHQGSKARDVLLTPDEFDSLNE